MTENQQMAQAMSEALDQIIDKIHKIIENKDDYVAHNECFFAIGGLQYYIKELAKK